MRTVLASAAIAVALAAAGCSESTKVPPPATGVNAVQPKVVETEEGWSRIDVGGTARSLREVPDNGVLVAGRRTHGGGLLIHLGRNKGPLGYEVWVPRPPDDLGRDGLLAATFNGESITGTSSLDPLSDDPAKFWLSDLTPFEDEKVMHAPRTRDGKLSVWLLPLADSDENQRVVGVTKSAENWRLHAWQLGKDWIELRDDAPQLYLDAPPDLATVRAANTAGAVIVGGDLATVPGGPTSASAWIAGDSYDPTQWTKVSLVPEPDQVTDVSAWDVGFWVAGVRNGRPVVYDYDTPGHVGRTLGVPDVRLEPARPTVLIALQPFDAGEPLVLGLQSVRGPQLWVEGKQGWRSFNAPAGRLESALVSRGIAYLIIDGQVWQRSFEPKVLPVSEPPTAGSTP